MEQIRKALSPPRAQNTDTSSQAREKKARRQRGRPDYFGLVNGGASSSTPQSFSTVRKATSYSEGGPLPPPLTVPVLLPGGPSIPPSLQPSANPSPVQSRPASLSHSMAHPQAYAAGPPDQPVQWRRASSLSSPFNPYYPTPIASTTLHILMLLVHLGILIVLGILLTDLRRTTATFHTMSNNGTGSYLRVGLYGGGLGSINRPFYVGGLGNASIATVTTSGSAAGDMTVSSAASTAFAMEPSTWP